MLRCVELVMIQVGAGVKGWNAAERVCAADLGLHSEVVAGGMQASVLKPPTRVDAKAFWHYKKPMKILWDEPKGLANLDKHKLDFADLTLDFFIASVVIPAKNQRAKAVGRFGKRAIVVIFKNLGSEAISVVSMRPANPKEKRILQ